MSSQPAEERTSHHTGSRALGWSLAPAAGCDWLSGIILQAWQDQPFDEEGCVTWGSYCGSSGGREGDLLPALGVLLVSGVREAPRIGLCF